MRSEILFPAAPRPVSSSSTPADGFPLIAFAATVQFAPDEPSGFAHVESRMLLAGESGRGEVEVDGETVTVVPGTVLVTPWAHRVRYRPDPRDPFLVYGAHLIPWHRDGVPVDLAVPHHRDHPLAGSPDRADAELAVGSRLWRTDRDRHPVLASLITSTAMIWDRGTPSLTIARALGEVITGELQAALPVRGPAGDRLPVRLRRILAWVNAEPGRPVTLDQLAAVAGASPATVTRLFRDRLGTSPSAWVLGVRIEVAKSLLTSTTLPIGQVARRSGFGDPYYFSRRFRLATGLTPSDWRRRRSAP